MRHQLVTAAILALLAPVAPAHAQCPLATEGSGAARTFDTDNHKDVDTILSMSMMPRLLHVTYRQAASQKAKCDLGRFDTKAGGYELRASDSNNTLRLALPAAKDTPLAELLQVTNLMDVIAAKDSKTVSPSGYMLATIDQDSLTGWLYYDQLPSAATLMKDMAAALDGSIRPVFRNDFKADNTTLFTRQ